MIIDNNIVKDFIEGCCSESNIVEYEPKAVTNIEGLYWWWLVGNYHPDIILESGICRGRSTEIIAKAQIRYEIPSYWAFDKSSEFKEYVINKFKNYRVKYKIKDSYDGFKSVFEKNKNSKFGVFIDGPKSGEPYRKIIELSSNYNCSFIASHDCFPSSQNRIDFESFCLKYFKDKKVYFISEEESKKYKYLNNYIEKSGVSSVGEDKWKQTLDRCYHIGICL